MKSLLALAGLGLIVVAQVIRPQKNLSTAPAPNDITALYPSSPAVKAILAKACYDCHSDHTRYPWYAEIQPVGWWLANHIREGKRELNFSQFGTYPAKRATRKLQKIADEVRQHKMPIASYTLVHRDAQLTPAEIDAIIAWSRDIARQMTETGAGAAK